MGSADYADDIEEQDDRFAIVSIIPAPPGMRAVLGKGKGAEEWPIACLALVESDEVRAVVLDDSEGATCFADEFANFSGFIYAGETLEDHVTARAAVLADEKARKEKNADRRKKALRDDPRTVLTEKQITDGTGIFTKLTKLTKKAKAKR